MLCDMSGFDSSLRFDSYRSLGCHLVSHNLHVEVCQETVLDSNPWYSCGKHSFLDHRPMKILENVLCVISHLDFPLQTLRFYCCLVPCRIIRFDLLLYLYITSLSWSRGYNSGLDLALLVWSEYAFTSQEHRCFHCLVVSSSQQISNGGSSCVISI